MECNIENRTNTNVVRRIAVTYNPSHARDTPAQLIRATVTDNLTLPKDEPNLASLLWSFMGEWPAELMTMDPEVEVGGLCEDTSLRYVCMSVTFTIVDYTGGEPQDVAQSWLEDCYDGEDDDYLQYLSIVAVETAILDSMGVE